MDCVPLIPATCLPAAAAAGAQAVTGSVADTFAETIRQGAIWIVKATVAWWVEVPAIDLNSSPAGTIRGYVLGLAALVAVGGVIWQGILLAVSRRPEPVLAVGRGLFLLVLWTAIGVEGPAAALRAGDAFSDWVLTQAAGGQAADRIVGLASLGSVTAPGAVMVLGLVVMLAGLVQAVLMTFREAAVVVLAGVVVLAASGSMVGATRPWLPKVVGWLLALICYKPAAALVYASALALVGDSSDVRTFFVGVAMMLLSIVALPALMRLFTWATGSLGGGGGGLAALASAGAASLQAAAAMSYRRSAATQEHARDLSRDLDGGDGPPPGQGPSGSPPSGAVPQGLAPSAGAAASGTAAATGSASTAAAAAGSVAPWLLAAQEAARRAKQAVDGASDALSSDSSGKEQP